MALVNSGYFGASGAPRWLGPACARDPHREGFRNLGPLTLRRESRELRSRSRASAFLNCFCFRIALHACLVLFLFTDYNWMREYI